MSQYSVWVVVPEVAVKVCMAVKGVTESVALESMLARAMAPYFAGIEVEPWEDPCGCDMEEGVPLARRAVDKMFGPLFQARVAYRKLLDSDEPAPAWDDFAQTAERASLYDHFMADYAKSDECQPHPDCGWCSGEGKTTTTRNPDGKWDSYVIGGVYCGQFDGYQPMEDPARRRTCLFCKGAGKLTAEMAERAWQDAPESVAGDPCHSCGGSGTQPGFPGEWTDHPADRSRVSIARALLESDGPAPYALLTERHGWSGRGDLKGTLATASAGNRRAYIGRMKAMLEECRPNDFCVVVNCHTGGE